MNKEKKKQTKQAHRYSTVYYFDLPFRQRNATCKLAATEDYRVLHKIMLRGCPELSIVSLTEWLERL